MKKPDVGGRCNAKQRGRAAELSSQELVKSYGKVTTANQKQHNGQRDDLSSTNIKGPGES